ncbi:MAG: hypothetical protein GY788_19625, partial [bacterium]|nr:hypothetical protein [bacterium]
MGIVSRALTTVLTVVTGAAVQPAPAQPSMPDTLPLEARRLEAEAIKALMGTGATFTFVGAGGQATGTSTWNLTTGTAYGAF